MRIEQEDEIQVSSNQIDSQFLSSLFSQESIIKSLALISKLGDIKGLAEILCTDLIVGQLDEEAVSVQRLKFGKNKPAELKLTSVFSLVCQCLEDTMLQILLVAAVCSTIIGMLNDGVEDGWVEGATIFLAIFLIVSITAGNNWVKERQFQKLRSKVDECTLQVIRGGYPQSIDSTEVVVGDILVFKIGDQLTLDGIMISGTEVKVDESQCTGESDQIQKVPYEIQSFIQQPNGNKARPNCLLMSGSKVVDGGGNMLVLTVGEYTSLRQMGRLLDVENPPTPLQQKLEAVAEDIGMIGTAVATLVFLALMIHIIISCIKGDQVFLSIKTLQIIIKAFMIAITIIVVAVPEGLPLAVTIALAFSVNKMKDQQNLVKNLASCETMGGANNICSDKTGTLTQNEMTVTSIWIENQIFSNEAILSQRSKITKTTMDTLAESIGYNTLAYPLKSKQTGKLVKDGNKTDCAMIELIDNWGYPLQMYRPSDSILRSLPFNSVRKRMTTIVKTNRGIRIYAKGASELILNSCTRLIGTNGSDYFIDGTVKQQIQTNVIERFASKQVINYIQMLDQSLRTIGIAFKDIPLSSGLNQLQKALLLQDEEINQGMSLVAIVGIKDPIRKDVPAAILQCYRSGIQVRMVTGDNISTATAIAKECGILAKQAIQRQFEVLEGSKFKELVGYSQQQRDNKVVYSIQNMEVFQRISEQLKVMARASPEDKFMLVTGLIDLGNVVAVTGDGANDAPALKKADVGFAMGISGSDISKDAADIIIMDDNFTSIITAIKWGRNIYNCIRKFLQFQLTVNIVALFMSFLGALILTESPLNAIQMLWINLIMDTFASLALATEPPSISVLDNPPHSRKQPIVSQSMYVTIIGQSLYQIGVLIFILFFLQNVVDLTSPEGMKTNIVQMTIFFHSFVLMQVFNSINSRHLDQTLNPFKGLFNNALFWIIQLITLSFQYFMIIYGGSYVQVAQLNLQQHLICLCVGVSCLLAGTFIRLITPCTRIKILRNHEINDQLMDRTLTSVLRRKSSVRMCSSGVALKKNISESLNQSPQIKSAISRNINMDQYSISMMK